VAETRGCILQFAKAPVPGGCKTRLQPRFTPAQSAAVARALTSAVTRALEQAPAGWDVALCCDDPDDAFLRALAQQRGFGRCTQGPGDLGERMGRAAQDALHRHAAVLIVGSDCVDYDRAYLEEATLALERGFDAVLGPAIDGGYVLIGLRRAAAGLFENIEWGTGLVAEQQRERLRRCGLRWHELPPRADLDRPEDLGMLCPGLGVSGAQALVIGRLSP
jgi:rSAM/selenodomain-associated transferase 1